MCGFNAFKVDEWDVIESALVIKIRRGGRDKICSGFLMNFKLFKIFKVFKGHNFLNNYGKNINFILQNLINEKPNH